MLHAYVHIFDVIFLRKNFRELRPIVLCGILGVVLDAHSIQFSMTKEKAMPKVFSLVSQLSPARLLG